MFADFPRQSRRFLEAPCATSPWSPWMFQRSRPQRPGSMHHTTTCKTYELGMSEL
ncbi:unnamed protein product [Symbiodinium necroappetens]|uniref:Uncharacterized protein n=1 Tax=Symbiodinium necroappetens TaxID=1628268 RepID=A0A812J1V6_9DINO|nr:unnamed protein product [Symbiodinium necroappetens]